MVLPGSAVAVAGGADASAVCPGLLVTAVAGPEPGAGDDEEPSPSTSVKPFTVALTSLGVVMTRSVALPMSDVTGPSDGTVALATSDAVVTTSGDVGMLVDVVAVLSIVVTAGSVVVSKGAVLVVIGVVMVVVVVVAAAVAVVVVVGRSKRVWAQVSQQFSRA